MPQQIPEPVSNGKYGKINSHECEWASAEAPCVLISHIFFLKSLKLVICDLKSKFPLNLKIKNLRFKVK
jgi:hypothetical protein